MRVTLLILMACCAIGEDDRKNVGLKLQALEALSRLRVLSWALDGKYKQLKSNNEQIKDAKRRLAHLGDHYVGIDEKKRLANKRFALGVAGGLGVTALAYANRERLGRLLGFSRPQPNDLSNNTTMKESPPDPRTIFSFVKFIVILTIILFLILICNYRGS